MSTTVCSEQIAVVKRCIHTFYQGLQWADQFDIQGGYVNNRNFRRSFLIDDDYVLGVFDDRSLHYQSSSNPQTYPQSTVELVKAYQQGQRNIKTLIVLEKEHYRLANSDTVGNQSKFLIDVVYPAIEGIRAQFAGDFKGQHWQNALLKAQQLPSQPDNSNRLPKSSGELLYASLLSDIYHDPQTADKHLTKHSPLKLFYLLDSPLNIDFDSTDKSTIHFIPRIAALPLEATSQSPQSTSYGQFQNCKTIQTPNRSTRISTRISNCGH
ncbi:MAG: hypothetical protein AAF959_09395 [Cyanobacteria bacterium P01_D01_bin.56]